MTSRAVNSLQATKVGLRGDQAVALYQAGSLKEATLAMADALAQSVALWSDQSLASIYCRRVLGHAVLWMSGLATDTEIEVDGSPARAVAGMCSNPEPPESIRDVAPPPIEVTWYLFSSVEYANLGVKVGEENLRARLGGRCVPRMEVAARGYRMFQAVASLDVGEFVDALTPWLEGYLYLAANEKSLYAQSETRPLLFEFADMPGVDTEHFDSPRARDAIRDAVLAFGMLAAIQRNGSALREAQVRLAASGKFPIALELFSKMTSGEADGDDIGTYACQQIYRLCQPTALSGEELFAACLRFWQISRYSQLAGVVSKPLSVFAAREWRKLVIAQPFSLLNPRTTVPAILAAIAHEVQPLNKLAGLLVAVLPAVRVKLNEEFFAGLVQAVS